MTDLAIDLDHWLESQMSRLRRNMGRTDAVRPSKVERDRHDGRHSINEDAVLTPIFHALSTGEWQAHRSEPSADERAAHRLGVRRPDPVAEFRRDPLTAPIPVQAITAAAVPAQSWRRSHLRPVDELTDSGRHRRITEAMRSYR